MSGHRVQIMPDPAVRAYLDGGVQWYPVHDEQRAVDRELLELEQQQHRDREALRARSTRRPEDDPMYGPRCVTCGDRRGAHGRQRDVGHAWNGGGSA